MILFFRLTTAVARRLPRWLLEFVLGTLMLRLGFFLHPLRRRIILANYRRILEHRGEEPSPERLKSILQETIPLYTRVLISMLGRDEDCDFARNGFDVEILPLIEEARKEGNGVILAMSNFGHFGHAMMVLDFAGVPLSIPVLDKRLYAHLPHGWPELFTSVGRSSWESLDALAENKGVVNLTMVNFLSRRPSYKLFGAPARLSYAPAKLAQASGAPILPMFSIYENGRCRMVSDGLIRSPGGPDAVRRMTEQLARVQEKYIGEYPAQWHYYEDFWNLRWMDVNAGIARKLFAWFGDKGR